MVVSIKSFDVPGTEIWRMSNELVSRIENIPQPLLVSLVILC